MTSVSMKPVAVRSGLALITSLAPIAAYAQASPGPASSQPIPTLMFFTLGTALAIGILLLVGFLRRRSNREAMRRLNDE